MKPPALSRWGSRTSRAGPALAPPGAWCPDAMRVTIAALQIGGLCVRYPMLFAGIAILLVVVASMLVEEGEVVTLETSDAFGQTYPTRLWIVELDGKLYVRGPPERDWVQRLNLRPQVKLTRNGETGSFRAKLILDPALADAVHQAMVAKYGRADGLVDRLFNRSEPAAILLEPTGAEVPPPRR